MGVPTLRTASVAVVTVPDASVVTTDVVSTLTETAETGMLGPAPIACPLLVARPPGLPYTMLCECPEPMWQYTHASGWLSPRSR